MASVQVLKYLPLGMSFSGILQLAGYVSPGWHRAKRGDYSIQNSLWYKIICTETCETSSIYKDYTDFHGYHLFRPFQIQTTIALLLCVIAIICLIKTRNTAGERMVKWFTISVYCSLLSGVLSLVPAGTLADILRNTEIVGALFPYSLLLTGLGGSLALVISLISLYFVQSGQTTNEQGVRLSSM